MTVADLHTLTGAYATHALEPAESAEFERHLAGCPACALEVAEFAATLARLAAADSVVAPEALKARVLAALPTLRQEAPRTAPPAVDARRPGPLRRGLPRLALAACLALAVGAGGVAVQQHQEADRARARATALQQAQDQVAGLLAAPDARTATGAAAGGAGVGTVVWSPSRDRAAFLASGMPAPGAGSTYQLWFNDSGTMRPAGLLPGSDGALLLSGPLDGASGIGVTVEPAGGSAHPSSAPVMLLSFG
ncbi:anti-sigma factor domain-containing protein [Kitasatospora sp. NPDC001309]|uniref:anti-sigma factor n=1 Tax=Kitasatospora sp. NPDC001309 TaxID=3364013 RepID=UPI0036A59E9B